MIARLLAVASSALTWLLIFGLTGLYLCAWGVLITFGLGWALITGGIGCLWAAALLFRGMSRA